VLVWVDLLNDCERHAHSLGAVDVIPKPIDFDRMIALVKRHREETERDQT
jgi:DNA-binding NtrC family response regulator